MTVANEPSVLKADSLNWKGQFFQSLAHMAPAVGIISACQYMASRSGSALPLATLFAMVLALMLAYCLSMLTRKYHGASGYFQIHSRTLGSKIGFTTSWLFFMYEPFNTFAAFFGFGVLVLEPFSKAYFGFTIPWWAALIVGNIITVGLSLTNIKSSVKATAILGLMEVLIVLVFGVLLLVKSDHHFHPEFFMPSSSPDGIGGLLFAFVFGFLLFMGFESGLPLTEETKDVKDATFKGLMGSVFVAGCFFIFMCYATVVGFGGGENSAQFAKDFSNAANPYGSVLAIKAFGTIGPWLIFIAACNSVMGCALAGHNSATRVFFSMGRAGILPKFLGKATKETGIPYGAALFQGALTFVATLLFYLFTKSGSPMDWFGFIAIALGMALLIIHLMTCISVFVAYKYKEKGDFNILKHGIVPIITGILVILPIWGSVYYNPSAPMSYAPFAVGIWFLVGVVIYIYLKLKHPERLKTLENEMEVIIDHNK